MVRTVEYRPDASHADFAIDLHKSATERILSLDPLDAQVGMGDGLIADVIASPMEVGMRLVCRG